MNTRFTWIGALGVGAGLMYLFDPQRGGERRQQLTQWWRRAGGAKATVPGTVDDHELTSRVKAALAGVVLHPKAIDVWVVDGHVTLSGPVLAHEIPGIMKTVSGVRGVRGVEQRLDTEIHPGSVGGLRTEE